MIRCIIAVLSRLNAPPKPVPTEDMRANGLIWAQRDGQWIEVCDTCGGNCGQCGMTGRLGNLGMSLDRIIETTEMYKPVAGLRRL